MPVTFQLLLTLVSSSNAENAETLWGFIGRYRPGVTPQTHPKLDAMVGYAINYYRDFVAPTKQFREPTDSERAALQDLRDALSQLPAGSSAEDIQNVVYEIGRREPFLDQVKKGKDGRPGVSLDWFNMLYQVLLGQEKGPRFGSFVAVYGVHECGRDDRRRAGAERVIQSSSPGQAKREPGPIATVGYGCDGQSPNCSFKSISRGVWVPAFAGTTRALPINSTSARSGDCLFAPGGHSSGRASRSLRHRWPRPGSGRSAPAIRRLREQGGVVSEPG